MIANCLECRHFYRTYRMPLAYGCRAYEFASQKMPNLVIHESSGMLCLLFEATAPPAPPDPPAETGKGGWLV